MVTPVYSRVKMPRATGLVLPRKPKWPSPQTSTTPLPHATLPYEFQTIINIAGPIKLKIKDEKIFFEYNSKKYYLLTEKLHALKIDPEQGEVYLRLENGIPIQIFGSEDTDFEAPYNLMLVRDADFAIVTSASYRLRNVDLSGVRVIEGAETRLIYGGSTFRFPCEIIHINGASHEIATLEKGTDSDAFHSRRVSVVTVENQFLLFVTDGTRMEGEAREIAELAIKAYQAMAGTSNIPIEREQIVTQIRTVAIKAYEAMKSGNYQIYQEEMAQLEYWGIPRARMVARVSREGSVDLIRTNEVSKPGEDRVDIYAASDLFSPIDSFLPAEEPPSFIYADAGEVKIGDRTVSLHKKNITGEIGPVFLLVKNDGFKGVFDLQLRPLPWQPILDKEQKTIGCVIGNSVLTPFLSRITGYFGPITVLSQHRPAKDGKPAKSMHFFPYQSAKVERIYYVSKDQLAVLGLDPGNDAMEVVVQFEDGMPVALFHPSDAAFEKPLYFTTVRDPERKLLRSSAGLFTDISLPPATVVENLPTYFVPAKESVRCSIDGRQFYVGYAKGAARGSFSPRRVSVIVAEGKFLLFKVKEFRLDETAWMIADLAIKAFSSLESQNKTEGSAKIRRLAEAAHAAYKKEKSGLYKIKFSQLKALITKKKVHHPTKIRIIKQPKKKAESAAPAETRPDKEDRTFLSAFFEPITPIPPTPVTFTNKESKLAQFDLKAFLQEEGDDTMIHLVQRSLRKLLTQLAELQMDGEMAQYGELRKFLRGMLPNELRHNRICGVLTIFSNLYRLKEFILNGNDSEANMEIMVIGTKLRQADSPNSQSFQSARPNLIAGPKESRMKAFAAFCHLLSA